MIVSHTHRAVFLCVPRTASRAMRAAVLLFLQNIKARYESVLNGWNGSGHGMDIPDGCDGYKLVYAVRNPYARMVAAYRMDVMFSYGDEWKLGFHEWLRCHAVHEHNKPLSELIPAGYAEHRVIRFEDLPSSWMSAFVGVYGRAETLASVGECLSESWRDALDDSTAGLIHSAHYDDFEQYGYERDSWK